MLAPAIVATNKKRGANSRTGAFQFLRGSGQTNRLTTSHEPALARSPAFRRQDIRPAKAGTPCQPPPFKAPMRDAQIVEARHEPDGRARRSARAALDIADRRAR